MRKKHKYKKYLILVGSCHMCYCLIVPLRQICTSVDPVLIELPFNTLQLHPLFPNSICIMQIMVSALFQETENKWVGLQLFFVCRVKMSRYGRTRSSVCFQCSNKLDFTNDDGLNKAHVLFYTDSLHSSFM